MNGQWIGRTDGTNPGVCVLELDDQGECLDGVGYLFDDNPQMPSVMAFLRTHDKSTTHQLTGVRIEPIQPHLGLRLNSSGLAQHYPNVDFPIYADISVNFADDFATVKFSTPLGTHGEGMLYRSNSDKPSVFQPDPDVKSWADFRNLVVSLEPRRFIYRGQSTNHRLRTSFHRTRRTNLARYIADDISDARRALSATLKSMLNIDDPYHTGALYNLLQHHGYPTPLLDWTLSPFVAAFFAFRKRPRPADVADHSPVRIFCFDQIAWQADNASSINISYTFPHFSMISLLGFENPRMVPQQAVSTLTNVDDIETFISAREDASKQRYLRVFEIPYAEQRQALRELDLMGINAGSMFPGLDGACESLRYKNFES